MERIGVDPGTEIGGYRVLGPLGRGGMGAVYRAVDGDGAVVALKLLHPHLAADPDARERLRREVAHLQRLRLPSVARVLDAEIESHEAFVVTELVRGEDLATRVRTRGPLSAPEVADLAERLRVALAAVHAAGVLHRDLTPGNVVLTDDGPVLIDFGIAQGADEARVTSTGLVAGTPGYLAPETLEGGEPSASGDWWGWAALLAFAATGRPPFGARPVVAVLARVRAGDADLAGLDRRTASALRSALAVDPWRRAAPEQVAAELARAATAAEEGVDEDDDDGGTTVLAAGAAGGWEDDGWGDDDARDEGDDRRRDATWAGPGGDATALLASDGRTRALPVGGGSTPWLGRGGADDDDAWATEGDAWPDDDPRSGRDNRYVAPGVAGGYDPDATRYDVGGGYGSPSSGAGYPGPGYPGASTGSTAYDADGEGFDDAGRDPAGLDGDEDHPAGVRRPDLPDPPRRTGTVLALALPFVAAGAVRPGVVLAAAAVVAVLVRSVGLDVDAVRRRRARRGTERGGTALGLVGWPWYLVRSFLGVVPAVLVLASAVVVLGGLGWWAISTGRLVVREPGPGEGAGELAGNADWVPHALMALVVVVGLVLLWFGPLSRGSRIGARWTLRALAPGWPGAVLLAVVGIGVAVVIALVVLRDAPPVVWWPLPGAPDLR